MPAGAAALIDGAPFGSACRVVADPELAADLVQGPHPGGDVGRRRSGDCSPPAATRSATSTAEW